MEVGGRRNFLFTAVLMFIRYFAIVQLDFPPFFPCQIQEDVATVHRVAYSGTRL